MIYSRTSECRRLACAICATLSFAVAGCSAFGPSDNLGPAAARPAPDPLGPPTDPTGTSEFNRNDGLDIINAEAAYARGATGAGVTVAIVDSGIDADHPDLAGNVSANSYDVVTGSYNVTDATGHGTKVAGVVAAEQNTLGTHGVAYDATLLAINAYSCPSGCGYWYSDLSTAVNYATDQLAHVINMSLSGSGGSTALDSAIQRAANAGAFVVIATGNNGQSQPGYPAMTAAGGGFGNRVVAVGAVTDSGAIASFSNDCGMTMNNCLVAPGVGIATTTNGVLDADDTTSPSGTSFAAPHVSGALALLIQLYPNAYAGDPGAVMMFMLDGANDLGAAGVDPVYGHGVLDVAGAIATADSAIAGAAIPTASGAASLADTGLSLGAAFGDALAGSALLDRSIAVITLSDGDHAYRARLDDTIATVARTFGLDALLTADQTRTFRLPVGDGASLVMSVAGDTASFDHLPEPWSELSRETARSMQVAGSLADGTDFRLGIDVSATGPAAGSVGGGADTLFWSAGETMNPLPRLAGSGNSLGIDQALGRSTTLSLGLFEGETAGAPGGSRTGGDTALGRIGLTHGFDSGAALRVDLGALEESSAFLGSQGAGAFATDDGASTGFVTLSGSVPVGRRLKLHGGVTLATTAIGDQPGSVLGDWDDVLSNAFAIGAVARDVLADGDRFGLMIGQPLRVFDAAATATVPVALAEGGGVVQAGERIDLSPGGREIDVQFAYDREIAPGMDMSSWLMMRIEPGHIADSDPAYGVGLSFRLAF